MEAASSVLKQEAASAAETKTDASPIEKLQALLTKVTMKGSSVGNGARIFFFTFSELHPCLGGGTSYLDLVWDNACRRYSCLSNELLNFF